MTSRKLSKEERLQLRQIRTRHEGAVSLARWASRDSAIKDRVLAELELAHRQADSPELADGLALALEVLDVVGIKGAAGMNKAAMDDIHWLLERIAE